MIGGHYLYKGFALGLTKFSNRPVSPWIKNTAWVGFMGAGAGLGLHFSNNPLFGSVKAPLVSAALLGMWFSKVQEKPMTLKPETLKPVAKTLKRVEVDLRPQIDEVHIRDLENLVNLYKEQLTEMHRSQEEIARQVKELKLTLELSDQVSLHKVKALEKKLKEVRFKKEKTSFVYQSIIKSIGAFLPELSFKLGITKSTGYSEVEFTNTRKFLSDYQSAIENVLNVSPYDMVTLHVSKDDQQSLDFSSFVDVSEEEAKKIPTTLEPGQRNRIREGNLSQSEAQRAGFGDSKLTEEFKNLGVNTFELAGATGNLLAVGASSAASLVVQGASSAVESTMGVISDGIGAIQDAMSESPDSNELIHRSPVIYRVPEASDGEAGQDGGLHFFGDLTRSSLNTSSAPIEESK